MTAIVTTPFRVVNAENFKEDIEGNSVYVGIGKSDAWSLTTSDTTDSSLPTTPLDNIDNIHEAYQNMIGMKKIASSDVSHIVPRHTWTSGTTYVAWDSDDATIYDKAFYIITSEFKVYKCIEASGNSTVEPTHINSDPTAESDGYKWKYMYTVTVTDAEKFLTISYMPVATQVDPVTAVGSTSGSSTTVTLTAANEYIKVGMLLTGSGITAGDTVTAISGTTLTISNARTVPSNTTLTFGRLASTDVNYANQTAQMNSGNTSETAVAGIERYEVSAGGSSYTSAPTVTINGDGTGALATATIAGGAVTGITVSSAGSGVEANKGDGYSVANVVISGGGGTGATARAVIAPPGGHGTDPVKELGAFYVAVNTQLSGSESGDLTVGNDFRQISLIKNPHQHGSAATATATTLRARKSLVLASGASVSGFAVDQVIVGSSSGAKAYLVEIDTTNKVLYYYQNAKTGYIPFVSGDTVTGTLPSGGSAALNTTSGTTWYGQSTNGYGPEVKMNSGQLMFLENRDPINRSSSQIEDIKLIIEF
tara:strand:- start:1006 stop:2616 length:1611 start_codon:yes stop_codon:yes gene_type:complete